jgi:hypothetical protein
MSKEKIEEPIIVEAAKIDPKDAELLEIKKANAYLVKRLDYYEIDGVNRLLFALNRKANEMAILLNNTDISKMPLDDAKDKTFDRLKAIWSDAGSISNNIKALESLSKSGTLKGEAIQDPIDDEMIAIANRPIFTPESMADAVGELAGKKY